MFYAKLHTTLCATLIALGSMQYTAPFITSKTFTNSGNLQVSGGMPFNIKETFTNNGKITSADKVLINCTTFEGNGLVSGPVIIIKTKNFTYTGTIDCSQECTIITTAPIDEQSFKRSGNGKFKFIVEPSAAAGA